MCCVALLSVLFFMVGMQDKEPKAKSKLESRPTGSPDSSRTETHDSNADASLRENVDNMEHPEENGLRRYPSFEDYVVSERTSRARSATSRKCSRRLDKKSVRFVGELGVIGGAYLLNDRKVILVEDPHLMNQSPENYGLYNLSLPMTKKTCPYSMDDDPKRPERTPYQCMIEGRNRRVRVVDLQVRKGRVFGKGGTEEPRLPRIVMS